MEINASAAEKITKSISFNGYEFDIYSNVWNLNKNSQLNLDFIFDFDISVQDDVRSTLAYFAEQKSSGHCLNVCREIKAYSQNGFWKIDELSLLSMKSIYSSKRDQYRLAVLRVFLKQMYFLEFESINDSIYELINSWRLAGNEKGVAVLSLDPEEGPFSDIEFEAIKNGLDNKYAESAIDEQAYSLVQLFAATGRRPIQIAMLKVGEFRIDTEILGVPTFMLSIPKAKVRGHT